MVEGYKVVGSRDNGHLIDYIPDKDYLQLSRYPLNLGSNLGCNIRILPLFFYRNLDLDLRLEFSKCLR